MSVRAFARRMSNKLLQALDLCNQKEFDKALPLLEEAVKDNPQDSEAWRTLAQVHWFHCHEPKKAYDELIEALRCEPKNIWALVLMGNLLGKEMNDFEHAKQYYDKVLEYHPDKMLNPIQTNALTKYKCLEDYL